MNQLLSVRRGRLENSHSSLGDDVVDNLLQITGLLEHLQLAVGAGAHLQASGECS